MKHFSIANLRQRSAVGSFLTSAILVCPSLIFATDSRAVPAANPKDRPKLTLTDFLSSSEKARLTLLAQKATRTASEEIELAALMNTGRTRATVLFDLAQKENRRRPALEKLQENLQGQLQTRIFLDDNEGQQFETLLRKKQRNKAEQTTLQKLMLIGSQHYKLVLDIARKENRSEEENKTLQRYSELAKRNSSQVKFFGIGLLSGLVDLQNQLASLFLLDDAESKRAQELASKRSRNAEENAQMATLRKNSTTRFAEFLSLSQKPVPSESEKVKLAQLRDQVIRNAPAISQLMNAEYEEIQRLNNQIGGSASFTPLPPLKASTNFTASTPAQKTKAKPSFLTPVPHQKARPGTIINLCPYIKIVGFDIVSAGASGYTGSYRWLNGGARSVTAFEIVTLPYDTFNEQRRVITSMVRSEGKTLFGSGAVGTQKVSMVGEKDIYTVIGYIRRVRLSDGTIWQVDEAVLHNSIKKSVPGLKQVGRLSP